MEMSFSQLNRRGAGIMSPLAEREGSSFPFPNIGSYQSESSATYLQEQNIISPPDTSSHFDAFNKQRPSALEYPLIDEEQPLLPRPELNSPEKQSFDLLFIASSLITGIPAALLALLLNLLDAVQDLLI